MKVESHRTAAELSQLIEKARRPKLRQRLRIIALALDGLTAEQAAERTKSSRRRVQEWVARWNREGVAGLEDQPGRGSKLPLDAEQQAQLKQRLDAGPRAEDGVCTLRGEDVRRILRDEFNVGRSLAAVYYLLHRLGYASLAPRPRHRKTDPARQDRFLKKSCPSNSRKFAASTPTSGC
jgi:transposase